MTTKPSPTKQLPCGEHPAALALAALCLLPAAAHADDAELAKKLNNPLAAMISVPVQSNFDFGVGPGDGTIWRTNIQPVIPFDLNDDWNIISRTILPVVDQQGLAPAGYSLDAFGLGDTLQSIFFSPKEGPLIWGVGPAVLIPTATDERLGAEKLAIGPTAVVLRQDGPWTYGALANHLWDIAGASNRGGVNATFIQPFIGYATPTATSFSLNTECSYDWLADQWTLPVNFQISQIVKIGCQPVQLFVGSRYYFEKPDNGPEWGLRFGITLLFGR